MRAVVLVTSALRRAGYAVAAWLLIAAVIIVVMTGAGAARAVEGAAPPQVALVVPLTVPAGESGLVSAAALEQFTAPGGLLSRRLDAILDRPVTIAIDPMIIVSIRVLGSDAPPSATTWLDRLRGATNETFALSYSDADLTLALQAGSGSVPSPIGFGYALEADRFVDGTLPDSTVAPATPSATATPPGSDEPETIAEPVVPSTDALLQWPYTLTGIAWPVANTVTSADLAALAAIDARSTMIAESNLNVTDGAGSAISIGGVRATMTDTSVSEALQEAVDAQNADAWQQSLAALTADIAAENARQSGTQATIVATVDRAAPGGAGRLGETLVNLQSQPTINLVPLSTVLGVLPASVSLVESPQAEDRLEIARTVLAEEQLDAQFATIVDDPSLITAERRNRVLALLSASWVANTAGWSPATDAFMEDSTELRSSVQIVDVSNINFFTDRQSIQIPVSNTLDFPVRVLVSVAAQRPLLFIEQSPVELVIEPRSQKNAPVPVQSVSNGTVQLTVTLASPAGVPIGQANRVSVNVQAGWETPIVTVLAVLAIAVFVVGLIRNINRRRRQTND